TCTDDAREPNDTIDQAATQPPLDTGTVYGETSCPDGAGGTNPDWYRIDVTEDSDLTINLTGGSASDLDLVLTDDHGNLYGASTGTTSTESIERCLGPGAYYVKVYSSSATPAQNGYSLSYSGANISCTPVTCTPDAYEPDNDPATALFVTIDQTRK